MDPSLDKARNFGSSSQGSSCGEAFVFRFLEPTLTYTVGGQLTDMEELAALPVSLVGMSALANLMIALLLGRHILGLDFKAAQQ